MDGHDFKKKSPEMFGISALGKPSTPHQSLSLDVYQAALHHDRGPHMAQDPHHMKIPIDGGTQRCQSPLFELSTKWTKRAGTFGHVRACVDDRIVLGLHYGKDAFAPIDKSAIQKQMPMSRKLDFSARRMIKPILDDPSRCAHTVAALSGDLAHAVALNNPTLKPDPLAPLFVDSILPDKSPTASPTTKPLPPLTTLSVFSNSCVPT